jgi:uncharacterized membrane protein YfcA
MGGASEFLLIGLAGMAAGVVNALAGGGTLITFPVLTALGIPAVAANVTSTIALSPGYLGGTAAQAADLKDQKSRMKLLVPAGLVGGLLGGLLLLHTGERQFRALVPFLILTASALLAIQDPVRAWLQRRLAAEAERHSARPAVATRSPAGPPAWIVLPVGLAAIYGGYFGAGLSVIILAVLGLVLEDSLTRLNALKQSISFSANIAAAIFFLFSNQVHWPAAVVMAIAAVAGGAWGGRLAGRIKAGLLRWIVVVIGVAVSVIYFIRG